MNRARKRFGQHFLIDQSAIARIVELVDAQPDEHVLEIGPGGGALTGPLLQTGANLDVVEIDRDLARQLEARFTASHKFHLHQGDILALDFSTLPVSQGWKVVGNLPYNISTPLLMRLLDLGTMCERLVVMVQKEVANRMTASPGSKAYGRLSIAAQRRSDLAVAFTLGPDSFDPPPRVDSAVVVLHPRPLNRSEQFECCLEQILRQAFSARRKTIANALKGLATASELEASGIASSIRPDQIPIDAYETLAELLSAAQ